VSPASQAALQNEIDDELEPTLDFLGRLIAEASVEGTDAITRTQQMIASAARPLGGREAVHTYDGVPNLMIDWGSPDSAERLLLTGHADVVPADGPWPSPPFTMTRSGTTLTGRGTADMKGGLAAYVGALNVLARTGQLDGTPISLVVTGDEEVGSQHGMMPLLREGKTRGRWAVCAEPTNLDVYTGNRGVVSLRISVTGRAGHAGLPHVCANPIPVAARLVTALDSLPVTATDPRFDPPSATLTVTSVAVPGRPSMATIPGEVQLAVDRRLLPGETPQGALEPIRQAIAAVVTDPFGARIDVLRAWPPYMAADDDPLVRLAQEIVRSVGRRGSLGADLAADDSSWLGDAGISTILCGPGAPGEAHTAGERIDVSDVRDAIAIYVGLCLAARERELAGPAAG